MIENWKNTEHLGDCLEVMKLIPDKSIDFICTDLPYNTTDCSWDKQPINLDLLKAEYLRVIKPHGTIALFCQKKFTFILGYNFLDIYRYKWTWIKDKSAGFQLCNMQPLQTSEDIIILNQSGFMKAWNDKTGKPKGIYNPQMREGAGRTDRRIGVLNKKSQSGHLDAINKRKSIKSTHIIGVNDSSKQRYPIDSIYFPVPYKKERIHATQKPVALIEYLIKTYSNENDIVLDSTAGSFTLAEACLNTNTNYIVIEKDPEEFKKGSNRIKKHKQMLAERLF